jgi:hypothetical protein
MSTSTKPNATTTTTTTTTKPTQAELARLDRRMQLKWRDLSIAEERLQPVHVLERMYDAYVTALDAYMSACIRAGVQANGEHHHDDPSAA